MVFVRQLQGHTSPVTMAVINQSNVRGIYVHVITHIHITKCMYMYMYVCYVAYTIFSCIIHLKSTCSHTQGNIVSCTKSQICLWTVNGTLLASTSILIPGSFNLLCCAVSEVMDMYHTLYMYMYVHVYV